MARKVIYSVTLDKYVVDKINKEKYWENSFSKLINELLHEYVEKKEKEKEKEDRLFKDEVKMLFEMFVDDYFDSTTTDEDLNETYFRSMDPDLFENRVEDLESGLQVTVLEVSHNVDSFFDIFIEVSVDGETDQQTLPIKVHKDELGLYFEFLDDEVRLFKDGV